ncbi:MAG: DUF4177 domain-containing protein [Pseudoruegeria sp.]
MPKYEYKVVPAPVKGTKAKGLKSTSERFAQSLMDVMNAEGCNGWEYLRADTLPVEERSGLTGKSTTYQNMLVFRRANKEATPAPVSTMVIQEPAERTPPISVDTPEQLADTLAPRVEAASDPAEGDAPAVGPASLGNRS